MGPNSANIRFDLHQAIAANKREPSEERAAECRRLAAYYRKAIEDEKAALAFESEVWEEVKRLTDGALGEDYRIGFDGRVLPRPHAPSPPPPKCDERMSKNDRAVLATWTIIAIIVFGLMLGAIFR